jgi:hypothetical protein
VSYNGFFPTGHKKFGSLLITDYTGVVNRKNDLPLQTSNISVATMKLKETGMG